jgi:hypothetical protein
MLTNAGVTLELSSVNQKGLDPYPMDENTICPKRSDNPAT